MKAILAVVICACLAACQHTPVPVGDATVPTDASMVQQELEQMKQMGYAPAGDLAWTVDERHAIGLASASFADKGHWLFRVHHTQEGWRVEAAEPGYIDARGRAVMIPAGAGYLSATISNDWKSVHVHGGA